MQMGYQIRRLAFCTPKVIFGSNKGDYAEAIAWKVVGEQDICRSQSVTPQIANYKRITFTAETSGGSHFNHTIHLASPILRQQTSQAS